MTPRDTARSWLADPACVVLDFETTAIDGYAVEIAVVDMEGRAQAWERLWPGDGVQMDPRAEAVHGIRLDSLKAAPTFAQIAERVRAAVHGKNVIAYNATFDAGVFQREAERLKLHAVSEIHPLSWRCAMHLYSEHVGESGRYGGYKWQRLPGGDHSALGDARACLAVVRQVAGWVASDE